MCSDHYESLVILFYSTVYVSSFDKRRSSNAISFALIFHPKNELTPPSLFQFSKVCNSAPRYRIDFILTSFDSAFEALSNDTSFVEIGPETKKPPISHNSRII